jgi:hypothetical protein
MLFYNVIQAFREKNPDSHSLKSKFVSDALSHGCKIDAQSYIACIYPNDGREGATEGVNFMTMVGVRYRRRDNSECIVLQQTRALEHLTQIPPVSNPLKSLKGLVY